MGIERQRKRSQERQKEEIAKYYAERAQSCDAVEGRHKRKKEELEAGRKVWLEEIARSRPKNSRQQAAEERVHRIHDAIEERPPLPPKPHDLPRPVLDMINDDGQPSRPARAPRPISWQGQAKMVSNAYNLSDREYN